MPEVKNKYRFVGRAHTENGKDLKAGDVVEMTDERAANLKPKFERVGAPAAPAHKGDDKGGEGDKGDGKGAEGVEKK
jgi:hypothetical protein